MTLHAEKITIHAGEKTIVERFNFTVKPGEIWGILGQNGCGKTTFLHALSGFHSLTQGKIYLENEVISAVSAKTFAKKVAILFQETQFIFPQTVWDYVSCARFPHRFFFEKETRDDKEIIANALGAMDLLTLKKRTITSLSGGEKRRLSIAASIAQTAKIYLLDEPVNHLDVRYQIKTLNFFTELAAKNQVGVVYTLHDINLAKQFCNRILLMLPNGCILQGNAKELLTSENLAGVYDHPIEEVRLENGEIFFIAQRTI